MQEAVRLVIWDLDETFWRGTLVEGGISQYLLEHHDIVIELARRGIMSSICSKNDYEPVKRIFEERNLWEYFIFPSIDWTPKGGRIERMIESIGLRPATVMFIDDNPSNRGEVASRVPEVVVEDETFIAKILEDPRFVGKDDRALVRLKQYKVLEQRQADATQSAGDNVAFLRGCDIRVTIETDVETHIERAIELINRTNQLNFTKNRLPEDIEAARAELSEKLRFWRTRAGLVKVRDKYGDYGFVGFYMLTGGAGGANQVATHFCFSCRTLGMGIEQFVFQRLGRPNITVRGDVVSSLDSLEPTDWITLVERGAEDTSEHFIIPAVRLRGGCEMEALGHYFGMMANEVIREDNFVRNNLLIRKDSTQILLASFTGAFDKAPLQGLGYERDDFETKFFSPAKTGTWLVLSIWSDSMQSHYRHRSSGVTVPCDMPKASGGPRRNLLTFNDQQIINNFEVDGGNDDDITLAREAISLLREEFDFYGQLGVNEIQENLMTIMRLVPRNAKLIMLLQSETDTSGNARKDVQMVNEVARSVVGQFAFGHVVSVDDAISSDSERQKAADHFDRLVYFRVFNKMKEIIEAETAKSLTMA